MVGAAYGWRTRPDGAVPARPRLSKTAPVAACSSRNRTTSNRPGLSHPASRRRRRGVRVRQPQRVASRFAVVVGVGNRVRTVPQLHGAAARSSQRRPAWSLCVSTTDGPRQRRPGLRTVGDAHRPTRPRGRPRRRVVAPGFVSDSEEPTSTSTPTRRSRTSPRIDGQRRRANADAAWARGSAPIRRRLCSGRPVEGSVTALPAATCRASLQGAAASDGRGSGLLARLAPRSRPRMSLSRWGRTNVPSARDAVPPCSTADWRDRHGTARSRAGLRRAGSAARTTVHATLAHRAVFGGV